MSVMSQNWGEEGKNQKTKLGTGKEKLEKHIPKIHKYTKTTQKFYGGNDYQGFVSYYFSI